MLYDVSCPTCFKTIPLSQSYDGTYICVCGTKVHPNPESTSSTSTSFWIVLLGVLSVASFIHATNWDRYFFTIIPLKTKQILGVASIQDLNQIVSICEDRKKVFCQEGALTEISHRDPKNLEIALKVAQLQISRESYAEASRTLQRYFNLGGKDRLARYQFAVALSKTNQVDEAKKHLHYLVYAEKSTLDARAARTYVALLLSSGDPKAANKVIEHCRSLGNNAALFMEKELKEIRKRI